MPKSQPQRERTDVHIYCKAEEKRLIERAAKATKRKFSNYVLNAALKQARIDLAGNRFAPLP